MNRTLELVKAFHERFEHPVAEKPGDEPLETRQLRIRLLFEELTELALAGDMSGTMYACCYDFCRELDETDRLTDAVIIKDGNNVNLTEELDALCDMQYVLSGKILTGGFHKVFDREFEKVHDNNMDKAHQDDEHADRTIAWRAETHGDYGLFTKVNKDGKVLLFKDGKLIKPWDHTKVELNYHE